MFVVLRTALTNIARLPLTVFTTYDGKNLRTQTFSCLYSTLKTISAEALREQTKLAEKDKLYPKLEIELRGIDPAVLKSYTWFANTAANHLGIELGNCWSPRKARHERMTLLKSVHIYKKHRVQYEVRTYFRYMNFHKLTGSSLSTFLEYIERNLPEGVTLYAKKTEVKTIPNHLKDFPTF